LHPKPSPADPELHLQAQTGFHFGSLAQLLWLLRV
jgi:hypothetical protein